MVSSAEISFIFSVSRALNLCCLGTADFRVDGVCHSLYEAQINIQEGAKPICLSSSPKPCCSLAQLYNEEWKLGSKAKWGKQHCPFWGFGLGDGLCAPVPVWSVSAWDTGLHWWLGGGPQRCHGLGIYLVGCRDGLGQTLAPCALLLELFIPGFLGSCLEQFGVFSMLCDSKEGESDHCVCHLDSTGLFSWKTLVSKFLTPHTHTHRSIQLWSFCLLLNCLIFQFPLYLLNTLSKEQLMHVSSLSFRQHSSFLFSFSRTVL